ncbi:ClpP/crotonase-like domain-containing protein [Radiomyces spectabilis]|uniref:ClpP/crotonase-like domain-containing protein n=1 Tax=Radiomyces spectabilis TaxID=64574 RepID=UPI0022201711|nr:ClpP/crotonase-like domain-containing protein [Radiomyces spectabilis]KAI8390849.1 ClpP/crotonase-like domain-containing protein [Radiomyces spectabilis]
MLAATRIVHRPVFFTGAKRLFNLRTLQTTSESGVAKEAYVEYLDGNLKGIAVLNLDRPKAKNALSTKLLGEFRQALSELRFSSDARVLIVQSKVPKVFCAGADLKERATMSPSQVTEFLYSLRQAYRELETLPIPTIAAIDGAALGGGLEMALACDLRVAGPKARIGLPETKLAIIPGAGGTQRLPRLIGVAKAKELIYTASELNSEKAQHYGIVNYIDEEDAFATAVAVAEKILPQGPVALRMAKLAIDKGYSLDIDAGLEVEQAYYAQVIPTEDRIEGLTAFREKRAPVYKGR